MKSLAAPLVFAALAAAGAATPAAAAVETGAQLVSACRSLVENGHAEGSGGEPCKQFLVGLVMPQQETLTMGEPFRAERLGPNQDQKACFDLPNQLTFRQFAQHVLTYADRQQDMTSRPAYELAVRALEANYPCDPVYLQ